MSQRDARLDTRSYLAVHRSHRVNRTSICYYIIVNSTWRLLHLFNSASQQMCTGTRCIDAPFVCFIDHYISRIFLPSFHLFRLHNSFHSVLTIRVVHSNCASDSVSARKPHILLYVSDCRQKWMSSIRMEQKLIWFDSFKKAHTWLKRPQIILNIKCHCHC